MGCQVYANGMSIACKVADGKSIAAFPDVCFTPPLTPATPPGVPIPYPNTGMASDTTDGSKTVQIGGQEVMLKNKSTFKTSTGDEAGSAPKKGVVTSKIKGKLNFVAWSMDVKFEGENVPRHLDLMGHNEASEPSATPPWPYLDKMTPPPPPAEEEKCPCCHGPLHPNQKNEKGVAHPRIKEEDYYKKGVTTMQAKLDSIPGDIAAKKAYTLNPARLKDIQEKVAKQLKDAQDAYNTVANARNIKPPCENVHTPKDEGCGTHFEASRSVTSLGRETSDSGKALSRKERYNDARESVLGFNDSVKKLCRDLWREKGKTISKSSPVNHKTPLEAGGCPIGQGNLVPTDALSPECQTVDKAQTKLQEIGEKAW